MGFHLKEFRENVIKCSLEEFSLKLGYDIEELAEYENQPEDVPFNLTQQLLEIYDLEMPEIANYYLKRSKPLTWEISNLEATEKYNNQFKELKNLFLKTKIEHHPLKENPTFVTYAKIKHEVIGNILKLSRKPTITFAGGSNAGKTTLINSILGIEYLPKKWVPTTSIALKIVHIDEKPSFLESDDTVVFATQPSESNVESSLIKTEFLHDEEYFKEYAIASGSTELIESYGVHDGEEFTKIRGKRDAVYTIVHYIDAPILKACEIWDVPGTEASSSEDLSDDITALEARKNADIVVYMSQSTKFMQGPDMGYFYKAIENTPFMAEPKNNIVPFENIFLVASQAATITNQNDSNNDISQVIKSRLAEFDKTLPEDFFTQFNYDKDLSIDDIEKRTFTFEKDNVKLQKEFNVAFTSLLDKLIDYKIEKIKTAKELFFSDFNKEITKESNSLQLSIENTLKCQLELNKFLQDKPRHIEQNKQMVNLIKQKSIEYLESSIREISNLYDRTISTEKLISLMEKKNISNNKNDKQNFISWLQNDLNSKSSKIIKKYSEQFNKNINDKLESYASEAMHVDVNTFNFAAQFIGGLSTIATIGAFSFYFSTLGNLGGYILLSQVVSGLSALGISVGGTAAAASFISLIGGPMTVVIGMAIAIGTVISKLLGNNGWKTKFSNQIIKGFEKRYKSTSSEDKMFDGLTFKESLTQSAKEYWQKTHDSVNEELFLKELEKKEHELRSLVEKDPEELKEIKKEIESLAF